jgi:cyclophilin family peptidyl-prolyl cis-trans isomerase
MVMVWVFTVVCSSADEAKQGQRVEIRTELGSIVVEIDPASSPKTCETFLSYIHQHVYDGSSFYQKDEEGIQGGKPGPEANGFSGSGNFFQDAPAGEFKLKNVRGAIGLSRTVGDCNPTKSTNSTQFYIILKEEPKDDGEFSVFGHVVKGLEIADRIADVLGKDKDKPVKFDVIAL